MSGNSKPSFVLPKQLEKLLAMASLYFHKHAKELLHRLVVNAKCRLQEGYDYDNWHGGQHGHALYMRLPASLYFEVVDGQSELAFEIVQTLNRLHTVEDEHISCVFFEAEEDPAIEHWREQSGVLIHASPMTSVRRVEELDRIWKPGLLRLFLSHKASFKQEAAELKRCLLDAGVSAFVAHDDIEPTREWQAEIERALLSMDALATLLTPDFHDSSWTDQEVGVAIGRVVPIVPVRLGTDPYGFFGKYQAMSGLGKVPYAIADELFDLLLTQEQLRPKLTDALVQQFAASSSYEEANRRMELIARLESASPEQVRKIEQANQENSQVYRAYKVKSDLPRVLAKLRGGVVS